MKNLTRLAYGFSFCLFFSSCSHYYYGPNSANVPLFTEKDEGRISAAISGADETTGLELQTAYAFGKNFGGMLNFYATGGRGETTNSGNSTNEKGNGTLTEIGLGYFATPGPSNILFEIYGGVGGGTVNNDYELNESSKVGLTRFFVQPSLGYTSNNGALSVALATRFSSVNFNVKEARMSAANGSYHYIQIEDIRNNNSIIFFEPSLVMRAGGKNIKGQFQLTSSQPLKQKEFLTQGLNTSLGIWFAFTGKVKK